MTTTAQPPAEAVAKDAHWASTLDRLRARQRPTASLRICDDQDTKNALAEASAEQRRAQYQHDDEPTTATKRDLKAADAAVATAQAAVDDATIVLHFQAMERPAFEALKKAHPASEEQALDNFEVDVEAIGPPLIAASNTDGMTEEQAAEFLNTWSESEAAALFSVAWNIQQTVRMDLGKG
ncbi:hypothetical protein [Streptomyces sp. NPDC093589]|uniref:hypothetical protein n=1 Tax=Streptomyces sp. NPDC093589 TaxID=3366043 RepID=UPI003809E5B5